MNNSTDTGQAKKEAALCRMGKAQRAHQNLENGHGPAMDSANAENAWSSFLPTLCPFCELPPRSISAPFNLVLIL
ncbi:hypothetical protein [Microbulbifer sp.]|uniref:hypothetical protein n=1 Tax=Microbulbifer sp. TaxID=1908541 RepID=UPI003F3729B7